MKQSLKKTIASVLFAAMLMCQHSACFSVLAVTLQNVSDNIAVTDVYVQQPFDYLLLPGDSMTITAVVYPSDATDKRIIWSSSNPEFVTVDARGKVTAIAPGSSAITATTVSGGYQDTCLIKVFPTENPECYGMHIRSTPSKIYKVGESFDPDGMVLSVDEDNRGVYNTKVTEGFTVSGFDSSTPGKKTLTVNYKGYTDTYEIEVIKLLNIAVEELPIKKSFFVNEKFEKTGLNIYAYYTGGHVYDVTDSCTLSGFDSSKAGMKTITAEYKGKKTWFTVEVKDPLPAPLYVTETIKGDELILSLHIKNAQGIAYGDLWLLYDDEIFTLTTLESSTHGKLTEESEQEFSYYAPGTNYRVIVGPYSNGEQKFVFIYWGAGKIETEDFEICSFRFKINDLNAGKQKIEVIAANPRPSINIEKTSVEVMLYIPGDTDNNGIITSSDARLVLRASVGLEALTEEQMLAADTDNNKVITAADARTILRASVGLENLS